MNVFQIIGIILFMLVIPACLGVWFSERGRLITIAYGYVLQWAVMYLILVPGILLDWTLSKTFGIAIALSVAIAILGLIRRAVIGKKSVGMQGEKTEKAGLSRAEMIYLSVFLGIVLFQIYKVVFYAFADGDDSFYVATAQISARVNSMYRNNPYTGIGTELNFRYALAPFPMWFAGIGRVTGVNVAIIAHTLFPPISIIITYVIYNEIAKCLLREDREKRFLFMLLSSIYVTFSNVSQSMPETFLLTRSRQGKEALANIIIPLMILLILQITGRGERLFLTIKDFLMIEVLIFSGAMTSVFSNILLSVLAGGLFIYMLVKKTKIKYLLSLCISVIPAMLIVLVYYARGGMYG